MQRSQQVLRKPSSSKVYGASLQGFYPKEYNQLRPTSNTQYFNTSKLGSIPFNQSSAINFSSASIQNISKLNSTFKGNSNLKVLPHKNKVYFSYNPRTANVERHYIQTIIRQTEKPFSNEWEQRYFQLYKQINELLLHNQKISQQFLKIREELKISNEAAIQNSIQNFTRTQNFMENNNREQTNQLRENYQRLKLSFQKSEHEASLFKEQNIRRQNMIQKLQSQLISEKNLTFKIQMQKNQISNQNVKIEYELKEILAEKVKLETEIYELKLALAHKNIEFEQFTVQKQHIKKGQQRSKQPEKMSQQKFEQKLTRLRTQYQKKEKKFQKLIQAKQKQNSDLRKFITQVEQKERTSRELKQNYQKLYNEKKTEVSNMKKIQQSLLASQEDQRQIVFYEQRINQLNKLAGEQAQKIKQLEKIKADMNKKIEQYQDNYVTQEHLNYLHQVIQKKENKILEEGGINYDKLNNKAHSYFNGKVFQEKMIYQLKKDNQKLMELVQKINFKDFVTQPQVIFNQNVVINNESSGISMEMQKMISDIFFKLDRVTQGMRNQSNRTSEMIGSNNQISPTKSKKSKQSPRKSKRKSDDQGNHKAQGGIAYKISHELETLKVYIVNLSATCDRLVRQLQKQQHSRIILEKQHKDYIKTQMKINEMIPKDEEIVSFYKLKNKQLQTRVNELLNLCNSLKEKLCERRVEENSGQDYWKNQVKTIKQELQELKSRYEKLLHKLEVSEDSKEQFETKAALFSLQIQRLTQQLRENQEKLSTIGDFSKQIQTLKSEKSSLSRELSICQHKLQELNLKINEYMNLLKLKENQNYDLATKLNQNSKSIQSLEQDRKDKLNKLQIHIRANQNLQFQLDQWRKKYEVQEKNVSRLQQQFQLTSSQLQKSKKNFSQIQLEITQLKSKIIQISHQLQSERKRLVSQQEQINRYRINEQEWTKRYSLLQTQYLRIKAQLQNEINTNSSLKDQLKSVKPNQNFGLDAFSLQKLRSRVIETETLIQELSIQSSNRNKQIMGILTRNSTQILELISEITSETKTRQITQVDRQYIQKIHTLEERIKQMALINSFKVEFMRSLLIKFDCLMKEMNLNEPREKEIVNVVSVGLEKGLDCLATFDLF